MSMTTVAARVYIARIIGGANDSKVAGSDGVANEALLRGYQDWQEAKNWEFLLRDTSTYTPSVSYTADIANGATVLTAPSTGAFDFVNIGQTVTVTGGSFALALPAGTTVSSYTRNSDGTVATITLSAAFTTTGGDPSAGTKTLSFSANIPIKQGTNDYNLPRDYYSAYSALLITNSKRPLVWKRQRQIDRTIWDQSVQGTPTEYITYNPHSELSQDYGTTRLRFDRVPSADDTLLLRYYRAFTTNGTYVDIPDSLLYKFLDYCRSLLLDLKRAQDNPESYSEKVQDSFNQAQESDEEPVEDNDADNCMKSQMEMGEWNRPLWSNGQFDPMR